MSDTPRPLWASPVLVGILAGGWVATLLLLLLPALGVRSALADDPPTSVSPQPPPSSGVNPQPGPTVNPLNPGYQPRGTMPVPGGGTADSTKSSIALAASIGGGESVVYYFDTVAQRLLIYQYKGIIQGSKPLDARDHGGLRLLAARRIDYDLKLDGYRDLSEQTRAQLKDAYDAAFSDQKKASKKGQFPVKKFGNGK